MLATPPLADLPEFYPGVYTVSRNITIEGASEGRRITIEGASEGLYHQPLLSLFPGDTLKISGSIEGVGRYFQRSPKLQEALREGWITLTPGQKNVPSHEGTDYLGVGGLLGLVALSMFTSSSKKVNPLTTSRTPKTVTEEVPTEATEEVSTEVKNHARA